MSEWKERRLIDVAEKFAMGPFGSNIKAENFIASGVPVIRGTNLNFPKYVGGEFVFLSEDKADQLKSSNCYPGDLVFTHRGTIGQVGLIPEGKYQRYVVSQSGMKVSAKKDVLDKHFLFYFFKSDIGQHELLQHEAQVGVPSISNPLTSLKSAKILLPPLPEQRAIAGMLSSLDDKIDLLHRQNKTLEGMAETQFMWRFVIHGENWTSSALSDHIKVYRGLSYKGSGLCPEGQGIPMHNLNSVYEGGGYKYPGIKYYRSEFKERHRVKPGDVIIANTEQGHKYLLIGFPAIVPKLFGDKGIFSQHIYKTVIKDGSPLSGPFLYHLLKSKKIWEQVIGAANGSTVNMLAASGIETAQFKVPPRRMIEEFTGFAECTLAKQEQNILAIRTLSRLRDTLLRKLMSGEVRVRM